MKREHDDPSALQPELRVLPSSRIVGTGLERNHVHDAGLKKAIGEARRLYGNSIVGEYNCNDLNRMLGKRLNRKVTYEEKKAAAEALGFTMYEGSPRIPDHRLVVKDAQGRIHNLDFEHINPLTYNSAQIRTRINSGAIISGLNPRQTAALVNNASAGSTGYGVSGRGRSKTSGSAPHNRHKSLPAVSSDSWSGRRVKNGPDVISNLVGNPKVSK